MIKLLIFTLAACLVMSVTPIYAGNMGVDTTSATTDGTIRQGAKQVILVFSADFGGTVNGVSYTWAAGGSVNFGPFNQDQTVAITYTISAGSIKIIRVQ